MASLVCQSTDYNRSRVKTDMPDDPAAHCLWWKEDSRIEYRQNVAGNDATTGESEFAATTKAFSNWQRIFDGCASLGFSEGPKTSTRLVGHDPQSTRNENVILYRARLCKSFLGSSDICWRDDNCGNTYDCWQHNIGTIGLTTTTYIPSTGQILGADVELNAASFVFTTVDAPVCVSKVFNQSCVATDVENTMTHEIGHLLGLAHTGNVSSTMSVSAPAGELSKRNIDPGSEAFICTVYQKGAYSEDCVLSVVPSELGKVAQGCSAVAQGPLGACLLLLGVLRRGRKH